MVNRFWTSFAICLLICLSQGLKAVDFGEEAPQSQWAAVVALAEHMPSNDKPDQHLIFCSGVLVHPQLVLSAAHCLQPGSDNRPRPHELQARLQTLKIHMGPGAEGGLVNDSLLPIARAAIHPGYLRDIRGQRDLALLILEEPAPIARDQIPPLALNVDLLKNRMNRMEDLRIVGFGYSEQMGSSFGSTRESFGIRRSGVVNIDGKYANEIQIVPGDAIDSLGLFRPSPREGDSGGPAFFEDSSGQLYVAGLVSRATRHHRGGFGASLAFLRDSVCWIEETSGFSVRQLEADEPDYCAQEIIFYSEEQLQQMDFLQMCRNPRSIPVSAAYTIYVLKKILGEDDCAALNQTLQNTSNLSNLYATYITDISPLAPFKRLERLILRDNSIESVRTLNLLPNLRLVDLSYNNVRDLQHITRYTNGDLWIFGDKRQYWNIAQTKFVDMCMNRRGTSRSALATVDALIELFGLQQHQCRNANYELVRRRELRFYRSSGLSDMSPLEGLVTLEELDLRDQAVSDLSFVKQMYDLRVLRLDGNPARDLSPLLHHEHLREISLRNMGLSDISALSELRRLRVLDVTGNRIRDFSAFERPGRNLQIIGKDQQN